MLLVTGVDFIVDDARQDGRGLESFEPDLIQYLIVGVPDRTAVGQLLTALSRLVVAGTVRLLDVVMLTKDELGAIDVVTVEELDELAEDVPIDRQAPGLLTEHDLELASSSLPSSSAGLVVVTEDRWAEPLSAAAKQAGGRIAAGELVPAQRVGAALNEDTEDLLARPPFGHFEVANGWDKMLVDPVEQLKTLAELRRTGALSEEEFTRQKEKIVGS